MARSTIYTVFVDWHRYFVEQVSTFLIPFFAGERCKRRWPTSTSRGRSAGGGFPRRGDREIFQGQPLSSLDSSNLEGLFHWGPKSVMKSPFGTPRLNSPWWRLIRVRPLLDSDAAQIISNFWVSIGILQLWLEAITSGGPMGSRRFSSK